MFPEYTLLNLMLIGGLWLLLPTLSPASQRWRTVVLLPLILVQFYYLTWRFEDKLNPLQWSINSAWQYLFFATESLVVTYSIWQGITLLKRKDRTDECNNLLKTDIGVFRSVDLFVPTYSESRAILTSTIAACKQIRYPNLQIWICDDGARPWLKELCESYSVHYLSRPNAHLQSTKAANLHWSIAHGRAEYVVCLDADFQPHCDFITRITSFLSDPNVGLSQAPQHFRNLDPVQRNLTGGNAWTEEQRFFFDVSLPSRDAWDNALCVGSCWATRRDIINQMRGFPTDSIVEDVYFGYRVKSLGYKTVYLNENLASGLAAEDTPSYVSQRTRWCSGAMALLSAPHGPIRATGLSLKDRLFYFDISAYWLTHLHLLLLLLAPIAYGFFGLTVFNCTTLELLSVLVPKNILLCIVFYWISEGRCMPVITPVQKMLTLFNVIPAILQGSFAPKSTKFKVTKKDIIHTDHIVHWRLAAPFILIGVLTVLSMTVVLSQNFNQLDWSDYSAYNTLLSAYSLVAVFLCCLSCVESPRAKQTENATPLQGSWWRTSLALSRRIFSQS